MHEDNNQFLSFLLEDLKKPVIIFLGAGSSMEGVRNEGEPFPSFEKIQREIIEKFGNPKQQKKILNPKKRILFEVFLEVAEALGKRDKTNSVLLDYLQGLPGYAHFQLAAVI